LKNLSRAAQQPRADRRSPANKCKKMLRSKMQFLALLAASAALQPPASVPKGTAMKFDATGTAAPVKYDSADAMADMIAAQHALKLDSVRKAKAEVYASYAGRIAALEEELAARTEVPIYAAEAPAGAPAAGKYGAGAPAKAAAPGPELTFLEYTEAPKAKFKPTAPLESTVMSVKRAIGPQAPGEICHVALQTGGRLPYVEGQSIGVLPPGTDAKTNKPHQQRLYSIASSRYGDDGGGTSVSLCVRRAVYVDPETGAEDAAKKGVCSNYLCDAKPGAAVRITGAVGKGMLLPDDDGADIIMVATGTGVAPFHGFIQRLFVERTPAAAAFRGRAWLLFGGPTSDSILYPGLWAAAGQNKPGQFELTLAISREQNNAAGTRMYVQDRITERADELFERLAGGAHLYLCGLKGMQPGIEAALEAAAVARGLDFKTWLKALRKEKRYHAEVY